MSMSQKLGTSGAPAKRPARPMMAMRSPVVLGGARVSGRAATPRCSFAMRAMFSTVGRSKNSATLSVEVALGAADLKEAHRQERGAAELEESVVPSHAVDADQAGPGIGDETLQLAARRAAKGCSRAGRWRFSIFRAARSSFPTGVRGRLSRTVQVEGTM